MSALAVVAVGFAALVSDAATVLFAVTASLGGLVAGVTAVPVDGVVGFVGDLDDWRFVFANADYLLGGAVVTVGLTIASILLGFIVGFPAGAVEVYGDGIGKRLVEGIGVVLRGTPIVVILVVMYFVVGVPQVNVGPYSLSGAITSGILGLGLRSAAYQSQIFRSTLASVDDGQLEAGRAIGLSRFEAVRHVVVPQALRRSIPGFQNEFTIVLKDTSIVFAIGLAELLTRGYDLFIERTTAVLEVIVFISAIYFVLTFATNRALDRLGDYYAIPEGEST
ncbi:MAG: amino acid ABC transporter permease [Halorubrum sp.]